MTGREVKHFMMLKKRFDFLQQRIAKLKAAGKKASFDITEAKALEWALDKLGK